MIYTESTIKLNEERKLRILARREEVAKRKEDEIVEPVQTFNKWLRVALANAKQEQESCNSRRP